LAHFKVTSIGVRARTGTALSVTEHFKEGRKPCELGSWPGRMFPDAAGQGRSNRQEPVGLMSGLSGAFKAWICCC
jgi:hypothetical protein